MKLLKKIVKNFHLVNDKNDKDILVAIDQLFELVKSGPHAYELENMFRLLLEKNKNNKKKLKILYLAKLKHHYLRRLDKPFSESDLSHLKMLVSKRRFMNNKQFHYMLLRMNISEHKYSQKTKNIKKRVK